MNIFINNITYWLLDENIIEKEDIEIYKYGIQQGLFTIINSGITLLTGFVLGVFAQSITLLLSYIPLRMYAGGVHARTATRCFIYTHIINLSLLLSVKWISTPNFVLWFIIVFAVIIIYIFSPIEAKNKPLSKEEFQIYGNKARRILATLFCIAIFLNHIGEHKHSLCIFGTIIITSITMICGIVVDRMETSKENNLHKYYSESHIEK